MKKFTFPLFSLLILWAFLFSGSLSLAQIPVVESHSSDALSITQGATSVSLPIPKPNGVQNGDLLIATIRVNCDRNTNGITITPPSGWTLVRSDENTSRSRTSLYYKIANNEGDIYTWQGGGGVSAFYSIFGGVVRISNADTNNPINVHSGNTTQNTSADVVASGVNTTGDNALLLYVGSISRVQGTFSTPAGMTKVFDRSTIYDGGVLYDDLGIMTVAWEDRPTAGSTGNRTASASAAGLYQTGQLLAINPGPPVPTEVFRSHQSGTWGDNNTWEQQFSDASWQNTSNIPAAEPITNLFYPDIMATARYQTGSTITNHSVTLPDGIQAGDLLLMVFRAGSTQSATTPAGWTLLGSRSSTGFTYAWYKEADGSEGTSVTVTTGEDIRAAAITYRIDNWSGTPEIAFAETNVNNPPDLFPSWGANDATLFIAAMTNRRSNSEVTVAPSNYIGLLTVSQTSSIWYQTERSRVSTAYRNLTVASEDPGAFSTSGTIDNPHSATIAIKGTQETVFPFGLVSILNNHTVTVNANQTASNVTVEQGGVLTVNSGNSLSIAENAKLTLAGQANINGTLNIADASTEGLVIEDGGSLIGNVSRAATLNRNLSLANWHTISSPLSGMTILGSEFAPFNGTTMPVAYDLFFFDQSVAFNVDAWYPWINLRWAGSVPNPNFDTQFVGAKGYLVYYPTGSFDPSFAFKGNLNAGDLSIPLGLTLANPEGIQGWNLIGNPYPSGFDWAAAMADNKTATEDVYAYVYDDNTDQYAPVDDYVAPNQGFFVKAAAQVSFTFKDQFRAHAGTFLKNNTPLDELTLQLSHANGSDIASLRLKEGTAFERDRQDALKLYSFSPNMPQLYFLTSDQVKVAISSVPEINSETSFSLGLSTPVTGEYTLSVSELSGIFQSEPIFLRDLLSGAEQNLQQNPEYSFQAQEGTDQERFIITFTQATHVPVTGESLVNIYTWEQTLYVNFSEEGTNRLLQLYDLGGRLVFSQTLDHGLSHTLQMKLEQGMYLVRIQSPKSVTTKRVFVR